MFKKRKKDVEFAHNILKYTLIKNFKQLILTMK